ncbi:MAG: DUF945 family protein [Gammaproteobacteria bacterium]|nr:DUF945 family protein [Gammaproteobacteria bacterium]
MKSLIFYSLFILLLCCIAVVPFVDGYLFKKNYLQLLNNANIPHVNITVTRYHLGWLRSTVKLHIMIENTDAATEKKEFDVDQVVKHGPFIYDPMLHKMTIASAYITAKMPLSQLSKNIAATNPQQDGMLQIVFVSAFSTQIKGLMGIPDFIWNQQSGTIIAFKGIKASFETNLHDHTIKAFHILMNTDSFSLNQPGNNFTVNAENLVEHIVGTVANNTYNTDWHIEGSQAIISSSTIHASLTLTNFESHVLPLAINNVGKKALKMTANANHFSVSVFNDPWGQGQYFSSKILLAGDFDLTDLLANFRNHTLWSVVTETEIAELTGLNTQDMTVSAKNLNNKLTFVYSPEKNSYVNLLNVASITTTATDRSAEIVENDIQDKVVSVSEVGKTRIKLHDFSSGLLTASYQDVVTIKIPTIKLNKNHSRYPDHSLKQNDTLTIPTITVDITNGGKTNSIELSNINLMNNLSTSADQMSNTYSHFILTKITFLNDSIGPIESSISMNNIKIERVRFNDILNIRTIKNANGIFVFPNTTGIGQTTINSAYGKLAINENVIWNTKTPISSFRQKHALVAAASVMGNMRVSIAMLDHYINTISSAFGGGANNTASILKTFIQGFVQKGYLKIDKTDYIANMSVKDGIVYVNDINLLELIPRSEIAPAQTAINPLGVKANAPQTIIHTP